jgi:GDPmannose 4,6-dehydratase
VPRALVTGVTGQDGWYLSRLLRAQGYDVFGLVRPGRSDAVPAGVLPVVGDVCDAASLRGALEHSAPDEIYNLASASSVAASWQQPVHTSEVNGMGAVRLLEEVREYAERSGNQVGVVQASSSEIFGAGPAPQDESTPLLPRTPYGAAKAFAHHAVRAFRGGGLHGSTAILFNHESPRRSERFVTGKISRAAARIALGSSEQLVLGNLDAVRDWGHAQDYVHAMTLIARHPEPDDFVIASGVSRTVAHFVGAAFAHVGIDDWAPHVRVDATLVRPDDGGTQRGDAARARAVLGWRPEISFEALVAEMVDAQLARERARAVAARR